MTQDFKVVLKKRIKELEHMLIEERKIFDKWWQYRRKNIAGFHNVRCSTRRIHDILKELEIVDELMKRVTEI